MATDTIARALALEAGQGKEPESYLKDADVDGNTLTLKSEIKKISLIKLLQSTKIRPMSNIQALKRFMD